VIYLILILLVIGVVLLWLGGRRQLASGLPTGRVIYIDTERLGRLTQPLYDPVHDLTGQPDYIIEKPDGLVPVEVKSGRAPLSPYPSHVLQLAAYCMLVHATYGERPTYGILKYADRAFAMDYSSSLENELLDVLAEIHRSHHSTNRCRACGYLQVCDQALD
jgi:CRISPR-associated exonuclease Cas4